MKILRSALEAITPVKEEWYTIAQRHLDNLTKPKGSLGRLEEFAARLVAITENKGPVVDRKVVFTFAGDHGVTEEGVSAYPREVTPQMVFNFLRGGAGVNVLAKHAGARVIVVDIGVDHVFEPAEGLEIRKVARGTRNMAVGPAMTREEAEQAVLAGVGLVEKY